MKKVLVIGGAGFIGRNVVKLLAERDDHEVTIADNLFRGKMDDLLSSLVDRPNVTLIVDDFTRMGAFEALGDDYDYVYMLAAVVGVEYTEKIPHELIRINSALILNMLEWIKCTGCGKVLFASTSECYAGSIESGCATIPTPETVPLCIEDITQSRFTYAVTKILGESGVLSYSRAYDFEATIVRYHNVYGPRMGFKHVIPQVTQRFVAGESPFKIFGHNQTRSFNYVDDAVRGTVLAMETPNVDGEIFHIGDMRAEIEIEELVRYIGGICGYQGDYEPVDAPPGSVSRRCPDTSKAANLLGYHPETGWRIGVEKTVAWYRDYLNRGGNVFE